MARLLLVEDDARIRQSLVHALTERGHAVDAMGRGMPALQRVLDTAPDVVILDLGLPDVDGAALLKMVRGVSEVPVVVATARDDERDIVRLLDAGADDYIVKPFSAAQLDARVRAVLRRTQSDESEAALELGPLRIDPAAHLVTVDDRPVELTRREFDLLLTLARRAGQVVSKRQLLAEVWRQPYGGADKTVDVHLSWLRRKLGETAAQPRFLQTVRGVGVKLVVPDGPGS